MAEINTRVGARSRARGGIESPEGLWPASAIASVADLGHAFSGYVDGEETEEVRQNYQHYNEDEFMSIVHKKGWFSCPRCKRKIRWKDDHVWEDHNQHLCKNYLTEEELKAKEVEGTMLENPPYAASDWSVTGSVDTTST